MENLLDRIADCQVCIDYLPHGANPVCRAHIQSKIAIIGQAPGRKVHESGVPWDDPSGDRLRSWLGIDRFSFDNPKHFAIIPMGFCYPGRGKSGDNPPRPECAPLWHPLLWSEMKQVQLTLLIGQYAQQYYLGDQTQINLTETVHKYQMYLPDYFPLPHPSPRNNIWLKKHPWFLESVIPELKNRVQSILSH